LYKPFFEAEKAGIGDDMKGNAANKPQESTFFC
jgi:hypothetical protein